MGVILSKTGVLGPIKFIPFSRRNQDMIYQRG